jgi:hypothetical protein
MTNSTAFLGHLLGGSWLPAVAVLAGVTISRMAGAAEPASPGFSHDVWGKVLREFVDNRGRVDYAALASSRQDLDTYVSRIEKEGPRTTPQAFPSSAHKLAYYLNAYNALVFKGVLARGPEKESVWKGGLISGYSFFVGMKVRVDGEETSLKSFEDKVIRAQFKDPRIHAALNCASIGCPRLPQEAFEPSRLEQQLDAAMTEFVEEERNVSLNEKARDVTISKIFDWFDSDFLDHEKAKGTARPVLIDYINRYRKSKPALDRTLKVRFFDYDKRINSR